VNYRKPLHCNGFWWWIAGGSHPEPLRTTWKGLPKGPRHGSSMRCTLTHPAFLTNSSKASRARVDTVVPRSAASRFACSRTVGDRRNVTCGEVPVRPVKDGRPAFRGNVISTPRGLRRPPQTPPPVEPLQPR